MTTKLQFTDCQLSSHVRKGYPGRYEPPSFANKNKTPWHHALRLRQSHIAQTILILSQPPTSGGGGALPIKLLT